MTETVHQRVGITVGIPTAGRPLTMEWAWSFKMLTPPINYNQRFSQVWNKPVADARNELAAEAKRNGSKYLFFLGDDTEAPAHALRQLIFRMENDPMLGVVAGIYCAKTIPSYPIVFRGNGAGSYWDWKLGEYFSVTGLGMDCTLIRLDVLEELSQPWFKTVDNEEFLEGKNKAEQWTEDLYFCKKVLEETDYTIYADASVICRHWDPIKRIAYTLPKDSKPMKKPKIGDKAILDLGCGHLHWEFHDEGTATRVDIREECEPDYRCDLRSLPFGDNQFDIVFSSHTLEHFSREEFPKVIAEWLRVMKMDGELRLIVPDLAWAAKRLLESDGELDTDTLNVFYGSQEYEQNFHKNGFTLKRLTAELDKLGLEIVETHHDHLSLIIRALYKDEADKLPGSVKAKIKTKSRTKRKKATKKKSSRTRTKKR